MTTIYVQFSNAACDGIISYFAGPQDPEAIPNIGQVEPTDERWKAFYDAMPSIVQNNMPTPV